MRQSSCKLSYPGNLSPSTGFRQVPEPGDPWARAMAEAQFKDEPKGHFGCPASAIYAGASLLDADDVVMVSSP